MKINFTKVTSVSALKNSVPVVILTEEEVKKSKSKAVKLAKDNFSFTGKAGQIHLVAAADQTIVVVGAGTVKEIDDLSLQKVGSSIHAFVNGLKIKDATVIFGYELNEKGALTSKNADVKNACDLAFGALLQSYRFNKYFVDKKKSKDLNVENVSFAVADEAKAKKAFKEYEILADNVFFARDLVSEPSNVLNPESYADICKTLKKEGLTVEVLGVKEMTKLNMNALLGVGQGSAKESKLVIFKWNGAKNPKDQPIAFVGKLIVDAVIAATESGDAADRWVVIQWIGVEAVLIVLLAKAVM